MLRIRGLGVQRGGVPVLAGVDFEASHGTTVAVIGPSGSGKTTLLRAIAGLETPARGSIEWDGADLSAVEAHRRGIGFVFQDYALFPHRDVAANVAFGLEMRRQPREVVAERVAAALATVGLTTLARRRVDELSGGEAQRVALARALVTEPRLLLLDEPLGALDRGLRAELIEDLRGLLAGRTAVYVTHDQEEAFALADAVVVLRDGAVAQAGTPEDVWRHPAQEWVARFLGLDTIVDGCRRGGVVALPWGTQVEDAGPEGEVRVVLHPGTFTVDAAGEVEAVVTGRRFGGDRVALAVRIGTLDVRLDVSSLAAHAPGESLRLRVDPEGVSVLPRGSPRRGELPREGPPGREEQPRPGGPASQPSGAGPAPGADPTGSGATGSRDASRAR